MIASRLFAAGAPSAYQPYEKLSQRTSPNEEIRSAEVHRTDHACKTVERGIRGCEPTGTYLRRVLQAWSVRCAGRDATRKLFVACVFSLLSTLSVAQDFDHKHSAFSIILQNHVTWNNAGTATTVDYKTLKANPNNLNQYLKQLANVQKTTFDEWTKKQQLAFLINTYNAYTLKLIIDHYPEDSIRDIGPFWKTPWEIEFIPLFGEKRSLDHIEHQRIREPGVYNEPRIHFAVNCASIGCPALRTEPFTADKLEQQLEDSTQRFLRDETRNRYVDGELQVSPIFKWYREVFQRGWNDVNNLSEFFLRYAEALDLNEGQRQALKDDNMAYKFLDYDWSLNEKE